MKIFESHDGNTEKELGKGKRAKSPKKYVVLVYDKIYTTG